MSDIISSDYGLLGNLLRIMQNSNIKLKASLEKPQLFDLTQENFYWLITCSTETTNDGIPISISNTTYSLCAKHDAIAQKARSSIKNKLNANDGEDYIKYLTLHLVIPEDSLDIKEIINNMVLALKSTNTYFLNTNSKKETEYDKNDKNKLIELLEFQNYSLIYSFYLYIYFSVTKHNDPGFYYGVRKARDLNEFNKEVICKYGTSSNPGMRAIISLAKKEPPNIFAMFEYAEMYYYGRNSLAKNLTKAFEWYFRAAGLAAPTKTNFFKGNLKEIEEGHCNPLAIWAIGYVLYNYHRSADLKNCENISYIDDLYDYNSDRPDEFIIQMALLYAYKSYKLNDTGAASNLIGNILTKMSLEDLTYYRKLLREENGIEFEENPIKYYEIAMSKDYVYGFNNYANMLSKSIELEPEKTDEIVNKYIDSLEKSTLKIETWALNNLGRYYLSGQIGNYTYKNAPINRQKAKEYFQNATTTFTDHGSVWACVNLLINYDIDYNNNEEAFQRLCNKILEFENPVAYKNIINYFNNQSCPYSNTNVEYFRSIISPILNDGKTKTNTEYYDELVEFCKG